MFSDLVEMARNDDSFSSSIVDFFSHPDKSRSEIKRIYSNFFFIQEVPSFLHSYKLSYSRKRIQPYLGEIPEKNKRLLDETDRKP